MNKENGFTCSCTYLGKEIAIECSTKLRFRRLSGEVSWDLSTVARGLVGCFQVVDRCRDKATERWRWLQRSSLELRMVLNAHEVWMCSGIKLHNLHSSSSLILTHKPQSSSLQLLYTLRVHFIPGHITHNMQSPFSKSTHDIVRRRPGQQQAKRDTAHNSLAYLCLCRSQILLSRDR